MKYRWRFFSDMYTVILTSTFKCYVYSVLKNGTYSNTCKRQQQKIVFACICIICFVLRLFRFKFFFIYVSFIVICITDFIASRKTRVYVHPRGIMIIRKVGHSWRFFLFSVGDWAIFIIIHCLFILHILF